MNITVKKIFPGLLIFWLTVSFAAPVQASPWAENKGYWAKTGGKFAFGLKNSLFGWLSPWAEAKDPKYKEEWEGFSAGVGMIVVNTAGGLIQLATFPIPVDFPDIGKGLHIPNQNCRKAPYGVDKSLQPAEEVVEEPVTEEASLEETESSADADIS